MKQFIFSLALVVILLGAIPASTMAQGNGQIQDKTFLESVYDYFFPSPGTNAAGDGGGGDCKLIICTGNGGAGGGVPR